MNVVTSLLLTSLAIAPALAQSPLQVEWQRCFGGTNTETLGGLQATSDGGFVLAGSSFSGATGNKTSTNSGDYDGWVIRLDSHGNKIGDWSFGGTNIDSFGSIQQTADGGFLAVGLSFSKATGTKTSTNYGSSDGWVVKLDSTGVKNWDLSFGGSSIDALADAVPTADGGYIFTGGAFSGATGNKTSVNYGSQDGWLIRLDASGSKIADVSFGGTGFDGLDSIGTTADGGFIVGARSGSGIDGSKTSANFGGNDFWLIKLDSNCNQEWEKTFGGSSGDNMSVARQTPDGGYILAGSSSSGISGTKTSTNFGGTDFWVIKLDAGANEIWQKCFGGAANDDLRSLQPTSDGGYILGGTSLSGISGTKTSTNFGAEDYWLVKIDAAGNELWQQSFGGTQSDQLSDVLPLASGRYLLAGTSSSGITGNKTLANIGNADLWLLQLALPAPRLEITRSGANMVLKWPAPSSGFELQQNSNLTLTNWTDISLLPADDGTNKTLSLPVGLQQNFYRLRGP